jgi:hypothetical protein
LIEVGGVDFESAEGSDYEAESAEGSKLEDELVN